MHYSTRGVPHRTIFSPKAKQQGPLTRPWAPFPFRLVVLTFLLLLSFVGFATLRPELVTGNKLRAELEDGPYSVERRREGHSAERTHMAEKSYLPQLGGGGRSNGMHQPAAGRIHPRQPSPADATTLAIVHRLHAANISTLPDEEVPPVTPELLAALPEAEGRALVHREFALQSKRRRMEALDPRRRAARGAAAGLPTFKYLLAALLLPYQHWGGTNSTTEAAAGGGASAAAFEVIQWMEYARYAGVQHVYWYASDAGDVDEETLAPYTKDGFLTLVPASSLSMSGAWGRAAAFQHFMELYGRSCRWVLMGSLREFVFMPQARDEKFLHTFLRDGAMFDSKDPRPLQVMLPEAIFQLNKERLQAPATWRVPLESFLRLQPPAAASRRAAFFRPYPLLQSAARPQNATSAGAGLGSVLARLTAAEVDGEPAEVADVVRPPAERIRLNVYREKGAATKLAGWGSEGEDRSIQPIVDGIRAHMWDAWRSVPALRLEKQVQRMLRVAALAKAIRTQLQSALPSSQVGSAEGRRQLSSGRAHAGAASLQRRGSDASATGGATRGSVRPIESETAATGTASKGGQPGAGADSVVRYYLSALVFNRVYEADLLNKTSYELWQWIEYYRYAGVEHVYWYDTARTEDEVQAYELAHYADAGLLTYHELQSLGMDPGLFNLLHGQAASEFHFLQNHAAETKWLIACDVDEYLFMPRDVGRGFLRRYLERDVDRVPEVTQVLVRNWFFVGQPQRPQPALLIERYRRRLGEPSPPRWRTKCIVQARAVRVQPREKNPHLFPTLFGETVSERPGKLRVNHYWGPRVTEAGRGTSGVGSSISGGGMDESAIVDDDSIQPVADAIRASIEEAARAAPQSRMGGALKRAERLAAGVEVALEGLRRWQAM